MITVPRPDWSEQYLAFKYIPGEYSCLDFVLQVQLEVFGRSLSLPLADDCMPPQVVTSGPYRDGDIALFLDTNHDNHVGVLTVIGERVYLVHNNRARRGVSIERFPAGVTPTLKLLEVYRLRD